MKTASFFVIVYVKWLVLSAVTTTF